MEAVVVMVVVQMVTAVPRSCGKLWLWLVVEVVELVEAMKAVEAVSRCSSDKLM